MTRATYVVDADWGRTGLFDHAQSDITSDVLSLSLERGRDYASQLIGRGVAGRGTLELRNTSGKYSRSNTSSPLSGLLESGVPIRVRTTSPSAAPLWYGYLERIEAPDLQPGVLRTARLSAIGGLARLQALGKVTIAPQEDVTTGVAIGAILDAAGWDAALRSIDAGQTTLRKWFVDELNALDAARDVEETEQGLISEAADGALVFEDRHHRLKGDHLDTQETFSDAAGATVRYHRLQPRDVDAEIFNQVTIAVRSFATQATAVLWTYEAEDALVVPAQDSLTLWAAYPPRDTPAGRYVETWVTPVVGTDITQTGVDNGDLSVAVEKYSRSMKITISNADLTEAATLTLVQARGAAVLEGDAVLVKSEDAASSDPVTGYGPRTHTLPGPWHPSVPLAQAMADFIVSRYKDPLDPIPVGLGFNANRNADAMAAALTLDLTDRITLVAENTAIEGADLGINGDYFIETLRHEITEAGSKHEVYFELSPAAGDSGYWILGETGFSELGETTRLAPP